MAPTTSAQPCATRHAVILAAGESKRTRPLTGHRPKPLIPLLGQPLLAHILDELVGIVDRVTLVIGYRAADIEAAFGKSYRGISLRYVRQEIVNGTAGALVAVGEIDEPFFLLYGDNLCAQTDILGVCAERYSMAGLRVGDARSFGVLQIADGSVQGIIEKPANPPRDALANPGIYHFDQGVFPALEKITPSPRGELELTDVIGIIAAEHRVGYHICSGHWIPVGTPWEALSAAQFLLARRDGLRGAIDPTARIGRGVQIDGSVLIGPGVEIAEGAHITGPTVIGAGCVIGPSAMIQASALEPGAQVGPQATLIHSVLAARASIGADSILQASWIDEGATVAEDVEIMAQFFPELRPTADTGGLLGREMLCTHGVVLGPGARIEPGASLAPGSVIGI